GEVEAQPVLVLVHRPHQAAVALLDQVGERQAAAAVALGDRHHQPQVALGQLAAGLLVADVAALQHADQPPEVVGRSQHLEHAVAQLLGAAGGRPPGGRPPAPPGPPAGPRPPAPRPPPPRAPPPPPPAAP